MASLPPGSERYHQTLQAARARAFELTREHTEQLVALLERWVEMVEGRIENEPDLMHNRIQMRDFTHDMIDRLVEQMAETTREQVVLTTEEMAEFHTRATVHLLEEANRTGLPVAFDAMSFRAAQSVLARPELSAAMVSVREEATAVADQIIQESIAVGRDSRQFARRLRPTILGADELPADLLDDFGRVGRPALREMGLEPTPENLERLRDQVGFIRRRSQLIARTETMNAEQEAGARFEANSPVVDLVEWFLSQRHPRKDVCLRAGTKVETRQGPRAIESVEVGDEVLSHRGRWRPVTQTYRRTTPGGRLLQLRFRAAGSRPRQVTMTPNHPVLTGRGWVPAGDLQTGDRGYVLRRSLSDPGRRALDDRLCTGLPDSAGNAPSGPPGTDGRQRCGGPQRPRRRTAHTSSQGAPAPTPRRRSGTDTVRHPVRPTSWGCQPPSGLERAGLSSPRASSTCPGCGSRSWDCPRLCRPPIATLRSILENRTEHRRSTEETCLRRPHTFAPRDQWRGAPGSIPWSRIVARSPSTATLRRSAHRCRRRASHGSGGPDRHTRVNSTSDASAGGSRSARTGSEAWVPRTVHMASVPWHPPAVPEVRMPLTYVPATLEAIEVLQAPEEPVFNLEVADDHSYVAGGVVVHNCDVLAGETDWDPHGHGPGLYDPRAVPARPHPRCLCGRRVVLRDPEDFGAERGEIPEMQPNTEMLVTGEGLAPSQVRMMERALETGRTRAASIVE